MTEIDKAKEIYKDILYNHTEPVSVILAETENELLKVIKNV